MLPFPAPPMFLAAFPTAVTSFLTLVDPGKQCPLCATRAIHLGSISQALKSVSSQGMETWSRWFIKFKKQFTDHTELRALNYLRLLYSVGNEQIFMLMHILFLGVGYWVATWIVFF